MTLSVVIPHYGDASPTLELVAELLGQLGAGDELIVSDDASPTPFPATDGVQVVRRPVNGGFGRACNAGAEVASGDLLAFLNSDLTVGPTFLRDLVDAAAPWQPCVAAPRIVDGDDVAWTARAFPTVAHQTAEWLTPLARWRHTDTWHRAVGHDVTAHGSTVSVATGWLVGAALLLPRADFEAVGGFDPAFYMNSEEVDLQRRLRDRGLPAVLLPAVTVGHVGGGSSDSEKRRRWVVDSRHTYAKKWGGAARLRGALTAATAVNLIANSARRLAGRPLSPVSIARHELALIWGRPTR